MVPLKTSENFWYFDVFKGIKREHSEEKCQKMDCLFQIKKIYLYKFNTLPTWQEITTSMTYRFISLFYILFSFLGDFLCFSICILNPYVFLI